MLADACVASSHCSATRTVTFDYFYITHSDKEIWRRYDIEEFITVFQLSYGGRLGGSVLLAGWLRVCASLPAAALQLSI